MSDQSHEEPKKGMSRRDFLYGAGIMIGAAGLASCTPAPDTETVHVCPPDEPCPECPTAETITEEVQVALPDWPWPLAKLDVEEVRKRAHLGYYEGACAYGAFHALVSSLADTVGDPYTNFPTMLMKFGEGGVAGWGSLCGGLNGACAAISLAAGEDYKALVHELVGWYTQTALPTDISNDYAVNHEFLVDEYKTDAKLVSSVSNSTLCHASVTNWCKASGFASGSSERSERCGRLTGDTAAQAAILLNSLVDSSFVPAVALSDDTNSCRTCHKKGKEFELGQWTRGKEVCTVCHTPHD